MVTTDKVYKRECSMDIENDQLGDMTLIVQVKQPPKLLYLAGEIAFVLIKIKDLI